MCICTGIFMCMCAWLSLFICTFCCFMFSSPNCFCMIWCYTNKLWIKSNFKVESLVINTTYDNKRNTLVLSWSSLFYVPRVQKYDKVFCTCASSLILQQASSLLEMNFKNWDIFQDGELRPICRLQARWWRRGEMRRHKIEKWAEPRVFLIPN